VSEDGGAKPAGEAATQQDTEPVTWYDIVESPEVQRSLRRLPGLCRAAVRLVWAASPRELLAALAIKAAGGAGLAVVLLLGRDVIATIGAAGRSGAGAGAVLPKLLLLTAVTAGLGFLAAIGREIGEILSELTSRHAQAQIIEVACAVELEAYDTPTWHNRLLRASMGGQFRPWQIVEGLIGLAARWSRWSAWSAPCWRWSPGWSRWCWRRRCRCWSPPPGPGSCCSASTTA
jgi:ATP-binding cassette, subfamily B, bacterial